jgi:ABC-type thiamine transport system ATPase subunit
MIEITTVDTEISVKLRGEAIRERLTAGTYSFEKGITALIGGRDSGAAGLSYLASGRCSFNGCTVRIDGRQVTQRELSEDSLLFASMPGFQSMLTVRQLIKRALRHNAGSGYDVSAIAEKFRLTPERLDRRLQYNGNERYRASAAVGYAYGKHIYSMGYMESCLFRKNYKACLIPFLELLRDEGMTVILATDDEDDARVLADHICYFGSTPAL